MRALGFMALAVVGGCGPVTLSDVPAEVFAIEPTYRAHVRPIFDTYCVACHTSLGTRAGGVELDRYESASAGKVHNVCVAVGPEVVEHFAAVMVPYARSGEPARAACEGWEVGSMPLGAKSRLTLEEQVILARWVETGGPQ